MADDKLKDKAIEEKKLDDAVLFEENRRKAKRIVDREEAARPVELIIRKLSDVDTTTKQERIFGKRFERGSFNFIVGQGEVGKGMVSMDIIARLSTGAPFPGDGNIWRRPIKILLVVVEDSDKQIAGRLRAAGADLQNIEIIDGPMVMRGGLAMPSAMKLDSDAGPLVKIAKKGNYQALFIETIVEHLGDRDFNKRFSTNNELDVRNSLAPFRAICREANIFGWALIHPRKSSGGEVADLISGSAAFYSVPRLQMYVFKDPSDESKSPRRLLCCGKTNTLSKRPTTLRFSIQPGADEDYGHVVWAEGKNLEDDRSVDDILYEIREKSKTRKDLTVQKAEEFLEQHVVGKQLSPGEIKKLGEEQGISWRAIERAKKNLGLVSIRENAFGGPRVLGWEIPKPEDEL